jgi:hypothetical protein
MSSDLLVVACRTLEDRSASPAMKAAATEALVAALSGGLALPSEAARLIWRFWLAGPSNRSWRHATGIGDTPDETIRAEAIAILEREDAGEDLRDLATDVLVRRGHAAHLEDRLILSLIERVRSGERAQEAVRLIEAVHASRGLAPELLRMVRDRWASSAVAAVRETAIAVAGQIAEPDVSFIERMLADPDVEVRSTMAHGLATDLPGRDLALGIVEARLRVEVHPQARAALLRAQAALVEETIPSESQRRR